ncbi:putative AbgT transporter [Candidatus Promineifilum breve]|uniref:AbgT transporter n=1 Tax=Candidatus Promineifilum breve TaxID=1806508 RepID=A0A160T4D4_9CHLR|nr:AbgT family transporter [Candidatus Promineifilum breve]CUS05131.2 putative AbgT transporter [Candidatus Promineifilum breve]
MSKAPAAKPETSGWLGTVERIGNKVPHPVLMFLYLIIGIIVLSALMAWMGVSVTEQIAVPITDGAETEFYADSTEPLEDFPAEPLDTDFEIQETIIPIRSLLDTEGIRFIFTSFVSNFAGFGVVAVVFVAMMGAGVAEESGLMTALIHNLVEVSPRWMLSFIIIFVGVLSSVATDAGYLILIPLGAAAFLSVKRNPLVGVAAAYGGVSAIFAINILITPLDAMLTEITNEAIALAGGQPITIVSNLYFQVVLSILLSIIAALITDRIVEPRVGAFVPEPGAQTTTDVKLDKAAQGRGMRFAGLGAGAVILIVFLLTVFPGAPLRDPVTGGIIGATPFMDSLLFIIMLVFLMAGIGYGYGAKTFSGSGDVIKAVTKTFAGLAGLVFMLLMISQFIAYFNYSNMPSVIAVTLAGWLEQANIGAIPLLVGFIVVIMMLDIIIPGAMPKWAIFAPIFVPLFIRLGTAPQTVLAAYRIGDSPMNVITPLMVYLPFIITVMQRYRKDSGIGTVIAMMLPYTLILAVAWIILFILWYVLGIPLGPGYPPVM